MSQWLSTATAGQHNGSGTATASEQQKPPPQQRRKVHKLIMQLGARMTELEAGDSSCRCQQDLPVIMEMSATRQRHDHSVEEKGAQHTFGSPPSLAFSKTDTTRKDEEVQKMLKAKAKFRELEEGGKPDELEEWVHSCRDAKKPEEDPDQSARHHPSKIGTATNKARPHIDRLQAQELCQVGDARQTGTAPGGRTSYQMRRT
ncbi:unnamed protein product [Prorocentrum cordatum]|uniref:Uncharacterized protein n=1 Tax=Prorocentrum cordatum TaxID=2364126 RepID=A0ABN9QAA7_9DINO|nr:unnamed protein product [Polarella glacialis]